MSKLELFCRNPKKLVDSYLGSLGFFPPTNLFSSEMFMSALMAYSRLCNELRGSCIESRFKNWDSFICLSLVSRNKWAKIGVSLFHFSWLLILVFGIFFSALMKNCNDNPTTWNWVAWRLKNSLCKYRECFQRVPMAWNEDCCIQKSLFLFLFLLLLETYYKHWVWAFLESFKNSYAYIEQLMLSLCSSWCQRNL